MTLSKFARVLGRLLALTVVGSLPLAAHAQDDWKFVASINLWLPSIDGTTSFPPDGGGPSINVSSDQIINAIKMAFMGTLDVKKGQWGLFTDVVYVDIGDSKSGTRDFSLGNGNLPAGLDGNLSLDVKALAWTIAGTYNVTTTPQSVLDVLAGARLLKFKQSMSYQLNGTVAAGTPLPARVGSSATDDSNWDAVIGIKGRANLGADRKWFIPYYLDVGGGASKFTWQAIAGAGYQFQWGSLSATWRYLDYKFASPNPVESVSFNGPTIAAAFQW